MEKFKNTNTQTIEYKTRTNQCITKTNKESVQKLLLGEWQLKSSTANSLTLLDRQSYFHFINENTFNGRFYSRKNPYGENIRYKYILTNDFQIHYHNPSGKIILKIENINTDLLILSREIASKTVIITFKKIQ